MVHCGVVNFFEIKQNRKILITNNYIVNNSDMTWAVALKQTLEDQNYDVAIARFTKGF